MKRLSIGVAALLLVLAGTSAAAAGVFVRSTGKDGAREVTTEISVDPTAVRVDAGGEAKGHTVIFRREEGLFWIIDHREKTYMEMTRQDLEQLVSQLAGPMAEARKMMEAQMANLPPEQRKMMEEMMKGKMPPGMDLGGPSAPPEYHKVQSGVALGSWKCDRWEGTVQGEKVAEVCAAMPAAVGIGEADFAVLREMAEFFAELLKAAGNAFPRLQGLVGASGGFEGLPLQQVLFEDGREVARSTVEEIRQRTFDGALFARPTGYEKKEPFKELGGR